MGAGGEKERTKGLGIVSIQQAKAPNHQSESNKLEGLFLERDYSFAESAHKGPEERIDGRT